MIDAGSQGLCILANFSEQFALADNERERIMDAVLAHVAGRVPVIVTTTHFSSRICAERSRQAMEAGAVMVMIMPPYHGATIRVPEAGIFAFFQAVSDAIDIPIMIQDAPVAGTALSASFLARMAKEIPHVGYFKIEVPQAAAKLRDLIALGGPAVVGPWDGEEAITLLADLEAGATGAMTGGGYPDGIRQITDAWFAGRREDAIAAYCRWLPLINHENRQCGLAASKALMMKAASSPPIRCGIQFRRCIRRPGLACWRLPDAWIPWFCAGDDSTEAPEARDACMIVPAMSRLH